jgi:hypothetical protein
MWFSIPITSRAVNVMGRVFTNCPLDECDIRTTVRRSFLRHLFHVVFSDNSQTIILRASSATKQGKMIARLPYTPQGAFKNRIGFRSAIECLQNCDGRALDIPKSSGFFDMSES